MAEDVASTRDGISGRTPVAVRVIRAVLYVLVFIRVHSKKLDPALSFIAISSVVLPGYVAAGSGAVILVSVAVGLALGAIFLPRIERSGYRMLYGGPLFGRYGGIPHRVGRATVQSAGDVTVRVPGPDTQLLLDQVTLIEDAVAQTIENNYRKLDPPEDWDDYWNRAMRSPFAGSSYRDALTTSPVSFLVIPQWLYRLRLLEPLVPVFLTVVILLSSFGPTTAAARAFLVQVAVVLGLLCALLVLAVRGLLRGEQIKLGLRPETIENINRLDRVSPETRAELVRRSEQLAGRSTTVLETSVGRRTNGVVVRFFARTLVFIVALNLLFLAVVGTAAMLSGLLFSSHDHAVLTAYGGMSWALVQGVVVLVGAYLFWTLVLLQLRDLAGVAIGTLTTVAVVPLIQYVTTGQVSFEPGTLVAVVPAVIAAAVGPQVAGYFKRSP
jgi:hypothetical protein